MDAEDGFAAGVKALEKLDDGLLGGGVDGGEGFVHEVDFGILDEGAGEEDPLLLAAGELGDLAVGELADADLFEGGAGLFTLGFADAFEPTEFAVGSHGDNVEGADREIPVD